MAKSCQKTDIRHGTAAANNAQDTLESRLCCFLYFPITYRYAGTRMYPQVRPRQGRRVRTVSSVFNIYMESIRNSPPVFWCQQLYSCDPPRILCRPFANICIILHNKASFVGIYLNVSLLRTFSTILYYIKHLHCPNITKTPPNAALTG